jgi:hypothetical protein
VLGQDVVHPVDAGSVSPGVNVSQELQAIDEELETL